MPLKSMTGFARSDGAHEGTRWHWEVRSVNGRGLDVRIRLVPGFEGLEPRVREAIARHIARGSVAINLAVQRETASADLRVNEAALDRVLAVIARLRSSGDFDRPRPESLLSLRGVLEPMEAVENEEVVEQRTTAMLSSLETALVALVEARTGEGQRLLPVLNQQFAAVEGLVATIAASPSRAPEAIRARITEQMQRLVGTGVVLDEARLYQEAALLATRADIEEEIARLTSHVASARELLTSREPVGRRFDFLTQEFNREANTLCAKSNDIEITRAGLSLKSIIDQMREQAQNIE